MVYDKSGQDILAPLLTVGDLRELGVTLHLLISSEREPIPGKPAKNESEYANHLPDAPAVYFVAPTEDNIQRICKDLINQTYGLLQSAFFF